MNLSGAHGAYGQDDHAEWLPMKRKTNHVNRPADNARSTIRCFCSSSELAGKAASSQDLQETFMKHVWQWLPGHASQDETGETCPRAQGSLLILSKSRVQAGGQTHRSKDNTCDASNHEDHHVYEQCLHKDVKHADHES